MLYSIPPWCFYSDVSDDEDKEDIDEDREDGGEDDIDADTEDDIDAVLGDIDDDEMETGMQRTVNEKCNL